MSKESELTAQEARDLARSRAEDLKGLSIHFGVFVIVILGLFMIDIATGPDWWFFFPAIAWGIGLAIHGWTVLTDRMFDEAWVAKKSQGLVQTDRTTGEYRSTSSQSSSAGIVLQSTDLIDAMRQAARKIPKSDVRQQALGLCASADQVLAAIEENPREEVLARDFLNRYLTPASSIIIDYSRLANRNIPSAASTLRKVETHDLPMLVAKTDEIYDRLHRGSLIDLEVAREMLSLDLADWEESDQKVSRSGS